MTLLSTAHGAVKTVVLADAASSNVRSWKTFADQINGTWRKGAGNFIECGKLLGEANDELPRDAFNAMVKTKLAFDSSVARRLICIAANPMLCSHVNKLPPCWSTLYTLSQVPENVLKAAIADGRVYPGMSRRDATALKLQNKTTTKATTAAPSASTASAELNIAWWNSIPVDRRQAFLDQLGRDGLCAVMSGALLANLRDHVIGLAVAGASDASDFAKYATNKLHAALRCAEQPESDTESREMMAAMLGCIVKRAEEKSITRSAVVIAEGKMKGRKK